MRLLLDYDNTILNCDSDYLLGKIILKLSIFNIKKKHINNIFYNLYEKKIINNKCYVFFLEKILIDISKIFFFYNYILKAYKNNIFINFIKNKIITTSTNKKNIFLKKKNLNNYVVFSNKKITNLNYKKTLNILKIKFKNFFFFSDSINDILLFYYNKNSIMNNSDNCLYLLKNIKNINKNFIYK